MVFIIYKNISSKMIIHQKSSKNQHYPESGQFHNTITERRWLHVPPFTSPHSFLLPYTFPINHGVSQGQTGNDLSVCLCLYVCVCECEWVSEWQRGTSKMLGWWLCLIQTWRHHRISVGKKYDRLGIKEGKKNKTKQGNMLQNTCLIVQSQKMSDEHPHCVFVR